MKLNNGVKMRHARLLILLGVSGILGGCGNESGELSAALEPIAQAAAKQLDRVTPEQMADWIISRKHDFSLLDIRSKDEFSDGHIKSAEHIPLAKLLLPETLESLPQERKLVVYSNGSEQAAKASVMLRLAGFDAYLLLGGYNHWQARILNPDIPDEAADDEAPEEALKRAVSCYFSTSGDQPVMKVRLAPKKAKGYTPPVLQPGGAGAGGPPVDEGC
ncbi:MAG: rhodanese-like domain-containing protein [Pseudomonadota bacterium]